MPLPTNIDPHETLLLMSNMASVVAIGIASLQQLTGLNAAGTTGFTVAGAVRQPQPSRMRDHLLQGLVPFITIILLSSFAFELGGNLLFALSLGAVTSLEVLVPEMVPSGSFCFALWAIGLGACGLYTGTHFVGRQIGAGMAAFILSRRPSAAAPR